jgi:hypothetical protein
MMLNEQGKLIRIEQENHNTIDHAEITSHENETYNRWQPQQIDLSKMTCLYSHTVLVGNST